MISSVFVSASPTLRLEATAAFAIAFFADAPTDGSALCLVTPTPAFDTTATLADALAPEIARAPLAFSVDDAVLVGAAAVVVDIRVVVVSLIVVSVVVVVADVNVVSEAGFVDVTFSIGFVVAGFDDVTGTIVVVVLMTDVVLGLSVVVMDFRAVLWVVALGVVVDLTPTPHGAGVVVIVVTTEDTSASPERRTTSADTPVPETARLPRPGYCVEMHGPGVVVPVATLEHGVDVPDGAGVVVIVVCRVKIHGPGVVVLVANFAQGVDVQHGAGVVVIGPGVVVLVATISQGIDVKHGAGVVVIVVCCPTPQGFAVSIGERGSVLASMAGNTRHATITVFVLACRAVIANAMPSLQVQRGRKLGTGLLPEPTNLSPRTLR